jgi:hypothetical protein
MCSRLKTNSGKGVTKFHTYVLLLLPRMKLLATKFLVEKHCNLSTNKYCLAHIITFPWHDKSQNIELTSAFALSVAQDGKLPKSW